ncbi:PREDICTED: junctophilin-1-like isoform X2 [Branchiostoma belcheri]|uniref:Junctophilin-1-like isoform X2 n=1 Tax=Branchiostoma belcheri TaxID=7741 RepID=A0A6P4YIT1_BRABE|nr:PREDICTED: junctophilin-1-like isoform X2 [Branchiostoma belcheri]
MSSVSGGRFDFDDGGTYCGGWEDGKAHGHGICTGPKGRGEYSGSWFHGFEINGVYTWPNGNTFEGQWSQGKRDGLGVETRGRWVYRGEWTKGYKGRYGARESKTTGAKYQGTWSNGLQDGYGSETYADGGTYQGQWVAGMRQGYGIRSSVPYGMASVINSPVRTSLASLRSDQESSVGEGAHEATPSQTNLQVSGARGGFVLNIFDEPPPKKKQAFLKRTSSIRKSFLSGLRIRKKGSGSSQASQTSYRSSEYSDIDVESTTPSSISGVESTGTTSEYEMPHMVAEEIDANTTETYMGEWKNDKRSGFGISQRSDGLRYEGEWLNNRKHGYGCTTYPNGAKEEGKYKHNYLVHSGKKKNLFSVRYAKIKERVDQAVEAALKAAEVARQKADIAVSRTAHARAKAEQADIARQHAREESDIARLVARQLSPTFHQPGLEYIKNREEAAAKAEAAETAEMALAQAASPAQASPRPSARLVTPDMARKAGATDDHPLDQKGNKKEQDSEQTTPKRKFSMKAVQDWLGSSFKKEEKPPPPPQPETVEAMATAMDVGISAGRPDVYENIGTNLEAPKVPPKFKYLFGDEGEFYEDEGYDEYGPAADTTPDSGIGFESESTLRHRRRSPHTCALDVFEPTVEEAAPVGKDEYLEKEGELYLEEVPPGEEGYPEEEYTAEDQYLECLSDFSPELPSKPPTPVNHRICLNVQKLKKKEYPEDYIDTPLEEAEAVAAAAPMSMIHTVEALEPVTPPPVAEPEPKPVPEPEPAPAAAPVEPLAPNGKPIAAAAAAPTEQNVVDTTWKPASEIMMNPTAHIIILVILLNIGFAVLFCHFLT